MFWSTIQVQDVHFEVGRLSKKQTFINVVCNRGDTIHYWTWTNYGALLHSSMSTTDNTIQYQGGLQTRKFGQIHVHSYWMTPKKKVHISLRGWVICLHLIQNLHQGCMRSSSLSFRLRNLIFLGGVQIPSFHLYLNLNFEYYSSCEKTYQKNMDYTIHIQ